MAEEEFVDLRPEGEQNKKKKSGCLVFLIVVLSLLLVALIVVAVGMNYIFGRLGRFENPTPGETVAMLPEDTQTDPPEDVAGLETVDATDVVFETVDMLQGDVINIMLIGQDRRPGEERARSDSMILVSMNKEKGTIRLTSFMRDLYVQIPGYLDNRLNVAYRYGGTELMNETFKVNFGVEIDGNVMVDFDEFTEIIEILGGVTLEISSAEAKYMNNCETATKTFKAGVNYFNAEEALDFTRMRYAAGGDYGRTDRQRRVLMAIAESFRNADIRTLWTAVEEILPHIVTNLDNSQIVEYATTGLSILGSGAQIETLRIPQDDAHKNASIRGMSVLVPNLEKCREDLQEFIYENEN